MASETVEIHDHKDFLLVVYGGAFSLQAAKRAVDGMIQACAEYDRSLALFDCNRMTGKLSIWDRFQTMVYGQKIKGRVDKLALVGRPDMLLPDRFAETVAVNRGINLKVFTDREKAVEWLKN
jgi:hypothetical protein